MTEPSKIEDNADIVNTILLWRIYDVLWLNLAESNPALAAKVAEAHENGEFVGPNPSVSSALPDDSEVLREGYSGDQS